MERNKTPISIIIENSEGKKNKKKTYQLIPQTREYLRVKLSFFEIFLRFALVRTTATKTPKFSSIYQMKIFLSQLRVNTVNRNGKKMREKNLKEENNYTTTGLKSEKRIVSVNGDFQNVLYVYTNY
jgi:hypothetical protein